MKTQRDVASFILRFTQDLWQTAGGEPSLQWRGTIRHVQGEEETAFTEFAEAVGFMQEHLTRLTMDALPGDTKQERDRALNEGLKLWEQFTASYTGLVFDALEHTLDQSEALRRRMEEAVRKMLRENLSPEAQPAADDLSTTLARLNAQIEELTDKVERLEGAQASADQDESAKS